MTGYPVREGKTLGVDVSSYQGKLDWTALADAGVRFAVLKATEGATHRDARFIESCISAAKEPRIKVVLPYHFLRFGSSGKAQASAFWNQAGRYTTGRPVVDFETEAFRGTTNEGASQLLLETLQETAEQFDADPIIYTARGYLAALRDVPGALDELAGYDLWLAQWGGVSLSVPAPFRSAVLWPFDGDRGLRMPNGVDADFDWFDGTEDKLGELLRSR